MMDIPTYKPVIKENLTTGNIRPQKRFSHQTECNRGHITHTSCCQLYISATTLTPISTGVSTTLSIRPRVPWYTFLCYINIYTVALTYKSMLLHIRRLFGKLYTKSRTFISTALIQPAAVIQTNKYSLRKEAIIIHFYYRSCTVLTCLMMQYYYHPLSYFF